MSKNVCFKKLNTSNHIWEDGLYQLDIPNNSRDIEFKALQFGDDICLIIKKINEIFIKELNNNLTDWKDDNWFPIYTLTNKEHFKLLNASPTRNGFFLLVSGTVTNVVDYYYSSCRCGTHIKYFTHNSSGRYIF